MYLVLYFAVILCVIVIASIYFQSLLIQGKGKFNCSSASLTTDTCNTTNPECSPYAITVIPGKTYRLRVASLTALSALSFQIEVTSMNTFTFKSLTITTNFSKKVKKTLCFSVTCIHMVLQPTDDVHPIFFLGRVII